MGFSVSLENESVFEKLKKEFSTVGVAHFVYPDFVKGGLFCTILDLWNYKTESKITDSRCLLGAFKSSIYKKKIKIIDFQTYFFYQK